jgi:hypothetical protein
LVATDGTYSFGADSAVITIGKYNKAMKRQNRGSSNGNSYFPGRLACRISGGVIGNIGKGGRMINLQSVFKQLKKERKRAQRELEHLDNAISAFGKVVGKVGGRAAAQAEKTVRRVRRRMSAAARKRIAAAQRLRWAKVKQQALKRVR